ncbi:unnamed protein product [Chrysoparadoxa australica]
MAGTRLLAQCVFTAVALLAWLLAWWQGHVPRAPLQLDRLPSTGNSGTSPLHISFVVLEGDEGSEWPEALGTYAAEVELLVQSFNESGRESILSLRRLYQEGEGCLQYADEGMDDCFAHHTHAKDDFTFFTGCSTSAEAEPGRLVIGRLKHAVLLLPCNQAWLRPSPEQLARYAADKLLHLPPPEADIHANLAQTYSMTFSLLNEDPVNRRCAWDFQLFSRRQVQLASPLPCLAVSNQCPAQFIPHLQQIRYLRPALNKLSGLASFHIQSQELQYARLSTSPVRHDSQGNSSYYTPEDLEGFLSANDFGSLDISPATANTTSTTRVQGEAFLHFMLFCPGPSHASMAFRDPHAAEAEAEAFAFEIPGWGGVALLRGDGRVTEVGLESDESFAVVCCQPRQQEARAPMGAFIAQLRRILGLPAANRAAEEAPFAPSNAKGLTLSFPQVTFLPSRRDGIADWEMDALMRAWVKHHRHKASEALMSLGELVGKVPQMEVSKSLSAVVSSAVDALVLLDNTSGAGNLAAEMGHAREALKQAEQAYFDPTMVPQLYFPGEHLLAVYLPLVAPLLLPVVCGLLQEYKRYRSKCKAKP